MAKCREKLLQRKQQSSCIELSSRPGAGRSSCEIEDWRSSGPVVQLFRIDGHVLRWRFPKKGVCPQIIHFHGIFPYKPSISGYPHLWKPPHES